MIDLIVPNNFNKISKMPPIKHGKYHEDTAFDLFVDDYKAELNKET